MKTHLLPSGKYYIGDIGYTIIDHKLWSKIVDEHCTNEYDGKFVSITELGHMCEDYTQYGDGEYTDNDGYYYSVDSGTLGILAIDEKYQKLADEGKVVTIDDLDEWGRVITFEEPFEVHFENGGFYFGDIVIYT